MSPFDIVFFLSSPTSAPRPSAVIIFACLSIELFSACLPAWVVVVRGDWRAGRQANQSQPGKRTELEISRSHLETRPPVIHSSHHQPRRRSSIDVVARESGRRVAEQQQQEERWWWCRSPLVEIHKAHRSLPWAGMYLDG